MSVTLEYAERQLRYWSKKVEGLRLTSNASDAKENEEGNENIPPTPPIRVKGEEKEKENKRESTARALMPDEMVESLEPIGNHPTINQVLEWVKFCGDCNRYPESIIREWYKEREFAGWKNKDGKSILNWQFDLANWRNFYELRKRLRDPERIPDARKSGGRMPIPSRASNWRGTRKEDLGNALG